ncbi:MAG: TRAP transporter substrate-binding protein [Lachnospiraceae bacterium]|nr:TRAP transporter substrate-binding protein [Lachnospiraceae bacterium]
MKRANSPIIGLAAALCVALCGCGSSGQGSAGSLVLKAGFSTEASDPRVAATELFAREVEEATEGRITVEIHTDGELGSDSELISGVVNGEVDITVSSAGNFSAYSANVGISAFPFLFDNFDDAWAFVDGEIEARAESELPDYNIKVLGHFDNGFRCVTTSEMAGPVTGVEDLEGLVIRTPENQIVMQTMLFLGATPRVLGFAQLRDALARGEFDAQENPIPVIYNNHLYEVQKFLAITNHSYDVMLFVLRDDIWKKLSEEDREILQTAAKHAQDLDREMIRSQTESYLAELEKTGMVITYPDLKEFQKKTAPIYESFRDSYDPELLSMVMGGAR